MPTIFSKILSGEIPCAKVWEDHEFLAFLDIQPVQLGHTLVIPKREQDYIFDMEEAELGRLMVAAQKVALKIKAATGCQRVCVMVIGYEVRHVHIHLIPTRSLAEIPFPPRVKVTPEQMTAMAQMIAEA